MTTPERKILLGRQEAALLPDELLPYVQVSPDVPAGTGYLFTLPPIFEDIEFDRSLLPLPKARCVITGPKLDPPPPR